MEKLIKFTVKLLFVLSALFILFGVINVFSVHNPEIGQQIKEYEKTSSIYQDEIAELRAMKTLNNAEKFGAFFGGVLAALVSFVAAIIIHILNSIRENTLEVQRHIKAASIMPTVDEESERDRQKKFEKALREVYFE